MITNDTLIRNIITQNHIAVVLDLNNHRQPLDLNMLDSSGFTPLAYAVQVCTDELPDNIKIITALLKHGANPNQQISYYNEEEARLIKTTPVGLAETLSHTKCLEAINEFTSKQLAESGNYNRDDAPSASFSDPRQDHSPAVTQAMQDCNGVSVFGIASKFGTTAKFSPPKR